MLSNMHHGIVTSLKHLSEPSLNELFCLLDPKFICYDQCLTSNEMITKVMVNPKSNCKYLEAGDGPSTERHSSFLYFVGVTLV